MFDWPARPGSELHVVKMSSDALELWKEYRYELETRMRPGGDLECLKDFDSKTPGTAARVACVFHCIEHADSNPWEVPVSFECMNKALLFMRCAVNHSIAAFQFMGVDDKLRVAQHILGWINRKKPTHPLTVRDVFIGVRSKQYSVVELVDEGLRKLQDHGYLRLIPQPYQGKGRPPSDIVAIRPDILAGWRC